MTRCYDAWAEQYPEEEYLQGGRSCYHRRRVGGGRSCPPTIVDVCARTCSFCNDSISLVDALLARRQAVDQAAPRFIAKGGRLIVDEATFFLKGVNWFGSEGTNVAPLGLRHRSIDELMTFLATHNFNAIRLPFNHAAVLANERVPAQAFDARKNPELVGVHYLEMLRILAKRAAEAGLLVLPTCHRMSAGEWPGDGLWFSASLTEQQAVTSWQHVAKTLCTEWNVMGADLQNEPHAASWGRGRPLDWNAAAERMGNVLLGECARWLIFVEGVGWEGGAPECDPDCAGQSLFWGENLLGVASAPLKLADPTKLVYSPHFYGPSVFEMPYMREAAFPLNLPAVWDRHFGFVKHATGQPVVVGEFGGTLQGKDAVWHIQAIRYLAEREMGFFYFGLQPESTDTGGLLKADWETPEDEKLLLLSQAPSSNVLDLVRLKPPPPPLPEMAALPPSPPSAHPPAHKKGGRARHRPLPPSSVEPPLLWPPAPPPAPTFPPFRHERTDCIGWCENGEPVRLGFIAEAYDRGASLFDRSPLHSASALTAFGARLACISL